MEVFSRALRTLFNCNSWRIIVYLIHILGDLAFEYSYLCRKNAKGPRQTESGNLFWRPAYRVAKREKVYYDTMKGR